MKLELLGSLFSYRSVKANTVICYEGDDAHEFYILMQGQVKIKASDDDSSSDSPQKMKELATVDSISWCVLDFFEIFLSFCAHI